jgi:hypothetical protein
MLLMLLLAHTVSAQVVCEPGTYAIGGICAPCPNTKYCTGGVVHDCTAAPGFQCYSGARDGAGSRCLNGSYCVGGQHGEVWCGAGVYGSSLSPHLSLAPNCSGPCTAAPGFACDGHDSSPAGTRCGDGVCCAGGASPSAPCALPTDYTAGYAVAGLVFVAALFAAAYYYCEERARRGPQGRYSRGDVGEVGDLELS